ncbi:hypothetical protein OJ996_21740 [Luteolibacter sp. GHJ8]|uniref:Uncharacterized protein n=1 Tax=Luteolibacter rhizosphaerae TaxID=2989719 RepID=A0ABT3G8P2_9BACT|nr:hypothetical protein [Luteolibacter rhizosphaerae]
MILPLRVIPGLADAELPDQAGSGGNSTLPRRITRDLPRGFTAAGLPAESGSRLHAVQGGCAADQRCRAVVA